MKTRIGIVFGGRSGEHEISIRSAKSVIEQIDKEKYSVVPIFITPDGYWLGPHASLKRLPQSTRELVSEDLGTGDDHGVGIVNQATRNGFVTLDSSGAIQGVLEVDVAFPVLHGTFGEDGTIQGMFEMAGLPYVGCGVLGSACGMDKVVMKTLFHAAGLPICKYVWFLRSEWESDPGAVAEQVEKTIGYPCFVKPANLGSSVGVSRAESEESLGNAIQLAAEYDRKIVVEECLDMREIECAVLGNDMPEASLPGEYIIRNDTKAFLDYAEKYSGTGNNEFVVPSPISNELVKRVRDLAVKAFRAIDASGLARVDFFLRKDTGALLVNEINTMPGLTDASGFPKMWEGTGVEFKKVIDELVHHALERHADRARNQTRFHIG
ncbi:MAG: D-alanine--D-alanine ligase family protein [Acidobacteriota bacterium]